MRHTPYESEYNAIQSMGHSDLLEYFLTRVFETDEVWFLKNATGWLTYDADNHTAFPVWPYRRLASDAALEKWESHAPSSVSLDHFLYVMMQELIANNVMIEVMPRIDQSGCLTPAQRLMGILEGMIDAGEYRLDG